MTPPIRMVSVPVEDLLFYKLKDLILEQSEGEWDDATIVRDAHHFANHLRPLLTAAPVREEGGAVDPQIIKRLQAEAEEPGMADSVMVFGPDLRALLQAYAALATRQEAPDWTARTEAAWAENNREEAPEAPVDAGEIEVWIAHGDDRDYDMGSQWVVGVYATKAEAEAATEADKERYVREGGSKGLLGYDIFSTNLTLRAQPQAREEAQPVAVTIFCPECSLPHVDEGEWATTRRHKTHQCQGCGHEWRPFPFATVGVSHPTTPPAPEAEKIIDRYEMADALLASGIAIGVSAWPDEQRRDALSLADAALAALQQEGCDHG